MIFVVERHLPWVSEGHWRNITAFATRDEATSAIKSYKEGEYRISQVEAVGVLFTILERY